MLTYSILATEPPKQSVFTCNNKAEFFDRKICIAHNVTCHHVCMDDRVKSYT